MTTDYEHGSHLPGPWRRQATSLRDLVFVLYRRRLMILAVAVPVILAGGGSLLGRTSTVTAACRVLVELTNVEQPRWNTALRNIDYDREMSTFINIAMSVTVADRAAAALVDSLPVMRAADPNLAGLQPGPEFRDFLLSGLDVNVVGESNILEFRHTTASPRVALIASGALRDAFIEYEDRGRRNRGAVDYYVEQVEAVRTQIDSLLAVRGAVLGATGYTSLEDELRFSTGAVAEAEDKLRKVQADRVQLEAEYSMLRSYLEKDPRDFPAGQDESRASTLVGWRSVVGKHEETLNSILSVHTPESLPARQQREVLDKALERLHAEEVAYTESRLLALQSVREREAELASQLAQLKSANEDLPTVYQRVSMLDSDIKSLRDLLDDLQGKLGEVRMSEMADGRVSKVIVLSEPEMVTILAGSKTMVYLSMVVLFAIALGIVAAFIQESLDHRVYAPRDIEEHLKLPVLSSVSKAD